MEGPGGYQFVGRTVQVWNRHRTTAEFAPGHPWLLRFFDQIRFHPVEADALLRMRDAFLQGGGWPAVWWAVLMIGVIGVAYYVLAWLAMRRMQVKA